VPYDHDGVHFMAFLPLKKQVSALAEGDNITPDKVAIIAAAEDTASRDRRIDGKLKFDFTICTSVFR